MPYRVGLGFKDFKRFDLVQGIGIDKGAPLRQSQHAVGELGREENWFCLFVVAQLDQALGLKQTTFFLAAVKRFDDAIEPFF